jgi:transcriptional regulator with XRE-family HTH domain
MALRETFARNLLRLRNEKDWSQDELAARAGVSRNYISNMENCTYSASLDVIEKVARALGVDPASMLQGPARRKV